ncbi:MAG TPA: ABC transporter permease subunit, partial [Candidatus Nanopelagicales bacterium]
MAQRSTAKAAGHAPWWLVAPALLAALVALLPLGYLVARAGSLSAVLEVLATTSTARLAARSLLLTGLVTCLATALGVAAAWLVSRTDLRGRRAWLIALVLPLAVPSYIGAFVWVQSVPALAGLSGAVLVLTLATYPFVLLPVVAALQRLDPALEEVAASLGRGRAAVAWQVTLRQVRPSILAGALLVALYVLSDFGAVAILRYEVFTWAIYGAYRSGYDPTRAAVLALLLVALAAVLVAWEARARGRASARIGSGVARSGRVVALGRWRGPAMLGLTAIVAAGIGVPAVTLVRWVLTGTADGRDAGAFGAALAASVWLSVLAAVACVLLAVPVGVLAARWPSRGVAVVERSTFVGHALPGIVVAIAMVFVGVRLLRPVYQEVPLLVLGYVVLFLPLAVGA